MALDHIGGNAQPLIDKEEHRYKNVGVKAVVLYGYDTATDSYYPVNISVNSDGSYSLSSKKPTVTERYDYGSSPIYYVGEAPLGTATSTALWTVTKFDLTSSSAASGAVARNIAWDSRVGGTYL